MNQQLVEGIKETLRKEIGDVYCEEDINNLATRIAKKLTKLSYVQIKDVELDEAQLHQIYHEATKEQISLTIAKGIKAISQSTDILRVKKKKDNKMNAQDKLVEIIIEETYGIKYPRPKAIAQAILEDFMLKSEIQPILDVYELYKKQYNNNLVLKEISKVDANNMWQAIKLVAERG